MLFTAKFDKEEALCIVDTIADVSKAFDHHIPYEEIDKVKKSIREGKDEEEVFYPLSGMTITTKGTSAIIELEPYLANEITKLTGSILCSCAPMYINLRGLIGSTISLMKGHYKNVRSQVSTFMKKHRAEYQYAATDIDYPELDLKYVVILKKNGTNVTIDRISCFGKEYDYSFLSQIVINTIDRDVESGIITFTTKEKAIELYDQLVDYIIFKHDEEEDDPNGEDDNIHDETDNTPIIDDDNDHAVTEESNDEVTEEDYEISEGEASEAAKSAYEQDYTWYHTLKMEAYFGTTVLAIVRAKWGSGKLNSVFVKEYTILSGPDMKVTDIRTMARERLLSEDYDPSESFNDYDDAYQEYQKQLEAAKSSENSEDEEDD